MDFVIRNGTTEDINISLPKNDSKKGSLECFMEILVDREWNKCPNKVRIIGDNIAPGDEGKMQLNISWKNKLSAGKYRIVCPYKNGYFFTLYLDLV